VPAAAGRRADRLAAGSLLFMIAALPYNSMQLAAWSAAGARNLDRLIGAAKATIAWWSDMTEGQIRQRVRSALIEKRGSELILSLIDEIVDLNIRMEAALRQIQALKSFESLKDHLITIEAARPRDPRPAVLKLDASQLLDSSDGFHGLEYSREGVPYRWTGPDREFSFSVFVSRTAPIEIVLRAIRLMQPELQSEPVLIADGEPVTLKFVQEGAEWVTRTVLPVRTDLAATHLTFVLAAVGSPPGNDDKRTLGIAFHALEIRPADAADRRAEHAPMLNGAPPGTPLASNLLVLPQGVRGAKAWPPSDADTVVNRAAD
jgi:hypothetical protein